MANENDFQLADDEEREEVRPGLVVKRGEDGRITGTELSSERAAEMAKHRHRLRFGNEDDVGKMLEEAGYTKDNPPPQYVVLMARQSIKNPVAMRDWRRHTGTDRSNEAGSEFKRVNELVVSDGQFYYTRTGLNLEQIKEFMAVLEPFRQQEEY